MSLSARIANGMMLALCLVGCSQRSSEATSGDVSQQSLDPGKPEAGISVAEAVSKVNAILDDIAARDARLPHREFDPAALATALGPDPKTQYEWVRGQTRWKPYAGLLRGARGVLLDRGGSSVDRAVLLGDLLRRSGHPVRLAHATLSPRQASDLLAGIQPPPAQLPGAGASSGDFAAVISGAAALVSARADPLLAAFKDGAGVRRSRDDSSAVEAMRDHWWVEYQAGDQWLALDLLAPAANSGRALVAAGELHAWEPASDKPPVPDEEWHSVKLSVVVERYDGTATTESKVFEHVLRPAEVLGMRIELTHYPKPWPEEFPFSSSQPNALADAAVQVRQWVPLLIVGDRVVDQSGIADDGSVIADPFSAERAIAETGGQGFMEGFGEALGGGAASQTSMTAEWLDFEFQVPGSAPRKIRRPLFDLLGPEQRAAKVSGFDAATNDRLVKRYQALVGMYFILIQPCAFTEDYVSHLAMSTFLETRGDVQRLAGEKDRKVRQGIASSIVARMNPSDPLSRLARLRSLLGKNNNADWFIDRPNVVIFGAGLPVVNADKAAAIEFIDIVSNSVGVRPDPALDAFQVRLRQGVVDTIAEQVALTGTLEAGENPATTFALGDAEAWQLIQPHDVTAARKLDWPADVVARLAEDLDAGYAAYVPKRAFDNGGESRWGWWRVDPVSGETVGVMDNGLHPALTEKKAADMTAEEKKAYYLKNYKDWKQLQRDKNLSLPISVNEQQMMKNMLEIEKWLMAP